MLHKMFTSTNTHQQQQQNTQPTLKLVDGLVVVSGGREQQVRTQNSLLTKRRRPQRATITGANTMRLTTLIVCSLCVAACLMPSAPVECGRLQDFIQNLVGGGSSSSSNNSNKNSNSNSHSNSNSNSNSDSNSNSNSNNNNDSNNDSDTAASNDSNEQPITPMMSAMNPFMRYPSFYDSFGPASFGAASYPQMSFAAGPMTAAMSPLAAMSSQSLASAFGPHASASFSPASFASFGSSSGSSLANSLSGPNGALAAYGALSAAAAAGAPGHSPGAGLSAASSLNNVYASSSSPTNYMGAYSPYYGRRRR